jgi:tRNA(adenine34) deaminase
MTDHEYLARCRTLADIAIVRGESPVGTVIVVDDEIVGEGIEASRARQDITCHAEVEAIRAAVRSHGADLSAATLYTTHEPCLLCSYVMRHHRVGRVVIEHAVPHVGGVTSSHPMLTLTDIPSWGPPPTVVWLAWPPSPRAGTSPR